MKFPKKLEKGACIGLVACSSFISEERLAACIAFLEGKGCVDDGNASERVADRIMEIVRANSH